ncbi:MAG: molybdenum ABC transporter ATP-binding protein [Nitratireductor sp.]|nr:molybdenum ABC transporter ATP-binding protein [Nitratireductor sp.]
MTLSVSLRHRFTGFEIDAAFSAPAGVTALFGRSGSGKTTIVNAIAGLLKPQAGRIALDDNPLFDSAARHWTPPHRRRIGYVFQEGRLFPHLTVAGNLAYGRRFAPPDAPGTGRLAGFEPVVDLLGIAHLLDRRPGTLSGGEKQRVAIGRALLCAPRLLLMDEPLAALDEPRKREILPFLESIRDFAGIPILYVSHALAEVARLATTVVVVENGRVVRSGPAEAVLSDPLAALQLGLREAGSLLAGTVARHEEDGLTRLRIGTQELLLPAVDAPPGAALRVRIDAKDVILARRRPEQISALNILDTVIESVQPGSGPGMLVQLSIGDQKLLARVTKRSAAALALAPGVRVFAIAKTVSVAPLDVGRFLAS